MAMVDVIQTGGTLVSPAVPDRSSRKGPLAYTGLFQRRSSRIQVPVKAFLVQAGRHRVLVDAGWGERCATRADTGRFAVLAGDTGYDARSWDELRLPGPLHDADAMRASLEWVRDLRADPLCAGAFAAHDPAIASGEHAF